MKKLVIFGIKNFAMIAHHVFTHDSDYTVVGFTVDREYLESPTYQGLPVIPFDEIGQHFPPEDHDVFVAIGIGKINSLRSQKVEEVRANGYRLAYYISTRSHVPPDLKIGPNSMVMDGVTVHPCVHIGQNTVIWNLSLIALHSHIGDHCWIASARCGEQIILGDYSFVGFNATIRPGVVVGKSNVIGAGALILRDTKDYAVYKGHETQPSRVPSYRLRCL